MSNIIKKIYDWKEINRLTDEEFDKAGFNEVIEIIIEEEKSIELSNLIAIQDYLLEHGSNDEVINDKIRELKNR